MNKDGLGALITGDEAKLAGFRHPPRRWFPVIILMNQVAVGKKSPGGNDKCNPSSNV